MPTFPTTKLVATISALLRWSCASGWGWHQLSATNEDDAFLVATPTNDRAGSGAVIVREMDLVDLDRAGHNDRLVEGKVIVTGPTPLLWSLNEALAHRIVMHVFETLGKLLATTYKPITKLMLPEWACPIPRPVQLSGRHGFEVLQNPGNRHGMAAK